MNEKMIFNSEARGGAQRPDYRAEIAGLLRGGLTPKPLKERILSYHENDIAAALELLSREERRRLYGILDAASLAGVLAYSGRLDEYMEELSVRKQVDVLSLLEAATAAECLQRMEKGRRNTLTELMDKEVREEILLLSSFDEDEIGSKMSTNFISIPAGSTVRQAMRTLIGQAEEHDNISTLYVVGEDEVLVGAIELKKLIIAREHTALEDITIYHKLACRDIPRTSYPYVYAGEPVDECLERVKDYSEDSIPVLDGENRLRGVLTSQELARLLDDVLGEDYARLAGLSAEEDLQEPLKRSIGKRLPWLVILLGLGLLVSSVVGLFEPVVAQLAVVVSFQSLILDMSGNVGTQSLAVTIRVLMDEQVSRGQKRFLVRKEARVGLVNGLILGGLSTALVGAYLVVFKGQAPVFAFSVSLCTGLALLASIVLSSLSGTVIPILFKRLNVDPAVASGPLITTVNDLIAVVSFYGLVWVFLINLLGF